MVAARRAQIVMLGTGPAGLRLRSRQMRSSIPMSTIKRIIPSLVLAAGMLAPGQVLADRAPSPKERSRIETMLRNEGFIRWGKIELDDDDAVWEVDDAYTSDGRKYDLKLDPDTLTIIEAD